MGDSLPSSHTGPSRVLAFLKSLSESRTLLGMHNDLKAGGPSHCTDRFRALTGKSPALWSCDFLFDARVEQRWPMVHEAERQWRSGAVVNLMWHACPPTLAEPCGWEGGILGRLSDTEWTDLITEGGILNRVWKSRLDSLLPYLRHLQERKVEILWRPLHEMNQGEFWWGGRPGPDGTAGLYRLTHDYLVREHGLANLIWTWDIQDLRFDWRDYHPGEDYFDLMALDMYSMGFTEELYRAMLREAGGKPIALGEVARLPSPEILRQQPRYAFVMGWADLVLEKSTPEELKRLAQAPHVLTLEDMPGWEGENQNRA